MTGEKKEGGLHQAIRHPIDWQSDDYYDEASLKKELRRVFEICHGCRRCFNLCNAFPRLFDAIDESNTMDIDGLADGDYHAVVNDCYLCDRCFVNKCPYVPPHPFDVDFPHLMLRAKAIQQRKTKKTLRSKLLSNTDKIGKLASIPVVVETINKASQKKGPRAIVEKTLGIHKDAKLPPYASSKQFKKTSEQIRSVNPIKTKTTAGDVFIFHTCFGRYNKPEILSDLICTFEHNQINCNMVRNLLCCGMPKMELGDFKAIEKLKNHNIPILINALDTGKEIVTPVPSCTLMLKQEWPLLFPDDPDVLRVSKKTFDPFEYLVIRATEGHFNRDFKQGLGQVAYHIPCHLSAMNIGHKSKDILSMIPDTTILLTDRCSGHNGSYGVKKETHDTAMKIGRHVFKHCQQEGTSCISSDCPVAGIQIESGTGNTMPAAHPLTLLRKAYGL